VVLCFPITFWCPNALNDTQYMVLDYLSMLL
jgi:hypothetical protein